MQPPVPTPLAPLDAAEGLARRKKTSLWFVGSLLLVSVLIVTVGLAATTRTENVTVGGYYPGIILGFGSFLGIIGIHLVENRRQMLVAAIVFISFGVVAAFCCAIVDGVFAARHIVTCHSLNGKCQLKCGTLTRLLRVRRRPQLPGRPAPVPPALGLCSSEHFGPVPGDHHRRHPGGLQGHGASVPDGLWPGRPSTDPLQPCPADSGLRRLPPDARARPDLLILPSAPSGLQMFRKDSCSRHMTLKEQAILRVTSGGGLCTTPPSCPGCRGLRFEWGPRAMTSANPGDLHQGRSGNWHAWNWGCWGSLASRAC
ncbi:transmembrane protein 255B isoform X3 [Callithrix jacchus]|uniref:transmembrane protein 255B isoform X3 n=1 Tax=Callithrix jacchus TaxID=9483 RepID=UPI00159E854F|nr:transmembrane protein 255B isoform X3 [Callithrix jacchus]